ncbi:MAG TPA: hypothetical protein VFH38_10580 [Jatrophihabitans sp.]|nr:hypothetical protein [Jatrophihabitans sp.]
MPELDQQRHRYAIATLLFRSPAGSTASEPPWGAALIDEIFNRDEFGAAQFWSRCTRALMDLSFEIVTPGWIPFDTFTWADAQQTGRGGVVQAAKQDLASDGIDLSGFDHLVVLVPNGPSDAGATGQLGDIALDELGGLSFFQHEVGHTLGFQHAFGGAWVPGGGNVYQDAFDVMGFTNLQRDPNGVDHAVPVPDVDAGQTTPNFWRSDRRLSAASLYRGSERFALGGGVSQILGTQGVAEIQGLCVDGTGSVLATIDIPGHDDGVLAVEYRPAVGDDVSVGSTVVVHSIGVNQVNNPPLGEIRPVWLEGTLAPQVNEVLEVPSCGKTVTVTGVSAENPPESVTVEIRLMLGHKFEPGLVH